MSPEDKKTSETLRAMPKNAFIFFGPPTSGKTTQTIFLEETIRAKRIRGGDVVPALADALRNSRDLVSDEVFIPALRMVLDSEVSPSIVMDNIPRTARQASEVVAWARKNGVLLHAIKLDLSEDQVVERAGDRLVCPKCEESYHKLLKPSQKEGLCDHDNTELARRMGDNPELLRKSFRFYEREVEEIIENLTGAVVSTISASGTVYETSQRMFKEISRYIFYKPEMAEGYLKLRGTLANLNFPHLFISGMPVFMYGGRALMKDFDILVPDEAMQPVATTLGLEVGEKHSSIADTTYLDIAPGVEINANLDVNVQGKKIRFGFDSLWARRKDVRFMGETCPIMGLNDLILFKLALGRQGRDDFGREKYDLSDVEGLVGVQNIDWVDLEARREELKLPLPYIVSKFALANLNYSSKKLSL